MKCFYCGGPALARCPRCRRALCPGHGDGACPRCRDPSHHLPSPALFRGSLLALVVASALSLWLLLRPAGGPPPPLALESPAPTVAAAVIPSPSPSPPPTPSPTPAATPSPTPAPPRRYVVQPGDNPSTIAQQCNIALDELLRLNPGLNPTGLQPGQELAVPPGARC